MTKTTTSANYFNSFDRYWFSILEHLVLPVAVGDEIMFLQFHRESKRCEWICEPQEFLKAEDNEDGAVRKKKTPFDTVLWDEQVYILANFVPISKC